jgi:hypothetical protein
LVWLYVRIMLHLYCKLSTFVNHHYKNPVVCQSSTHKKYILFICLCMFYDNLSFNKLHDHSATLTGDIVWPTFNSRKFSVFVQKYTCPWMCTGLARNVVYLWLCCYDTDLMIFPVKQNKIQTYIFSLTFSSFKICLNTIYLFFVMFLTR